MADETTNTGAATEAPPSMYPGLGRRKTAIARLRLIPNGSGTWKINGGRTLEKYFEREQDRSSAASPFEVTGTTGKFDVHVTCSRSKYFSSVRPPLIFHVPEPLGISFRRAIAVLRRPSPG